ncbi:hypothetical protein URH17368_0955 [Alicyclobacillus hesperidum URH17-3-68]|uniref:Uncharacterized protein n=1 Tax=Alicyclobacillus hesperidum TaxID=89784 RepID=A0AA37X558_9BACL|nr:hypothetical protein URH17368_0955 [Alicyclobacillus hesperidum URH17-3-68]GLV14963.1 hypothetical protein Heshes_26480 [Alicyclobacillus hesperidum]
MVDKLRDTWRVVLVWILSLFYVMVAYGSFAFQWWPRFKPLWWLDVTFGALTKWMFGS